MTKRFAVVYEAGADFRTATELADRVLVEAVDWLDEDLLPNQRTWLSRDADGAAFTWTGMKRLAREAGIKSHGHFDGEAGLPDATAARRAIDYLMVECPDLHAVVLVRDQDDQPERLAGLGQARGQHKGGTAIVVGMAVVERESWVLSGFEPEDETEATRLATERQVLKFDPCVQSHELTAHKDENGQRSPKRVLRELSGGDKDRERRCWTETRLEHLRRRGNRNGLSAYLQEVRDRLAPLIGHVPAN